MPTTAFPQASRGKRVFRFVWKSNDYFFYGLHRTAALKRATFRPYWRPNREQIQNWAYLYLLDLVIDGKVLLSDDPSVRWINHAYTPKTWPIQQGRFATLGRGFIRRINLHWFMIEKIARRAGFDVALGVLPIAATRLGIEAIQSSGALASSAARKIARRVRQRSATGTPT